MFVDVDSDLCFDDHQPNAKRFQFELLSKRSQNNNFHCVWTAIYQALSIKIKWQSETANDIFLGVWQKDCVRLSSTTVSLCVFVACIVELLKLCAVHLELCNFSRKIRIPKFLYKNTQKQCWIVSRAITIWSNKKLNFKSPCVMCRREYTSQLLNSSNFWRPIR